jgi:hypothetical protein
MISNAFDLGTGAEAEWKLDKHDAGGTASPDPFGDEENANFKYRTMTWWYAANLLGS